MKKSRIAAAVLFSLGLGGAVWAGTGRGEEAGASYRLAVVERADLESSVSATGTLSAVTTVQVGTQVSGQVSAIYVDFNDRVAKDQLLARIDPTLAQQSVREAEASLARSQAELDRAETEHERSAQLHESRVLTDAEMAEARYQLQVARANHRSAQIALERARRNLGYTEIHAPIDGVVVERNVDVGQTVAASLSAPQLFLIAQDLTEMQILASVDESDIGLIREGQPVHFTVQAYSDERFTGTVKQVRLQSATQENVVTYTAVVSVGNPEGRLLPGMTATVEFVTGASESALVVPNAALRYRPPGTAEDGPAAEGAVGTALWTLQAGRPAPVRVETGITDGQRTVVAPVAGERLEEGVPVVVGTTGGAVGAEASASPLQTGQAGSRPPMPGGF